MLKSVHFQNFKALRNATLPLGPCTVILGPNGSGKSTALQGIGATKDPNSLDWNDIRSVAAAENDVVRVTLNWGPPWDKFTSFVSWDKGGATSGGSPLGPARDQPGMRRFINGICVFSLDPESIAESVELTDCVPLISSGKGIGGVLDNLRDNHPDRFADLNVELARWLPEFSEIAPQVVGTGRKSFRVRTRSGKYDIPAAQLSHGTLFAIALITLAYLPAPPTLVCLEEPDRGIHPRLLRNVQDSIYRLAYPADFQERRDPVQVIATTHSPYFVNLFKDHPDEIVVANRDGLNVDFQRVSDQPGFHEIIHDSSLGDAWYTGVLGGVPSGS